MKSKRCYVWLYLSTILFCLLSSGCSREEQKVLVVLSSQMDLSYEDLKETAMQWAGEKNISLQVVAPKLSTVFEQQKVLEKSIKKNFWDLIMIEPLGEEELYPVCDYAKKQGSTIVSMQGSAKLNADYEVHPCDYEELGASMMDVLAQNMNESGSYVTMVPVKDSEIVLREELASVSQQKNKYQQMLATSRLQECGDIQEAYKATEELYQAYEMKGALFFSYIDGLGISQWKQSTGNNMTAVGIGYPELMEQAIENGTIDVLFYWSRPNLLSASLEVGYKAINGNIKKDSETVTTGIEGYRTLRISEEGVYYGSDISTLNGKK